MAQSRTETTFAPPVMEARRWIDGVTFSDDRPLINVSQAAPVDPPPKPMREAMAQIIVDTPEAHLYGPVLGMSDLRDRLAEKFAGAYGGEITGANVGITSGCNQAFSASIAALAGEGDEVILPIPYYFNHRMWLDMSGVHTVALDSGPDLLPDPSACAALITKRTKAIVLVTPNNPGGVEYPSELVRAFYDLAKSHGLALIIDETYRDFDSRSGPAHDLFQDPDWGDTLVQLYSFSKAYRLTGHRVGSIVTSLNRLAEIEKFLDTVTICPNQLGQHAALWGLNNLDEWLAGERLEILERRAAIEDGFPTLSQQGWSLMGCGAYFAYMRHPFDVSSAELAKTLVREAGVLLLPGTMFMPDGHTDAGQQLRVAFANVDRSGIETLFQRLANFTPA